MKRHSSLPDASATAAEWYVALDAGTSDEITDARFASWLDSAAESEDDLERCEAAVEIARRLADDPELRWAYDEAATLAKAGRQGRAARMLQGPRWPKLAWGIAAVGSVAVAAALMVSETRVRNHVARATAVPNGSEAISSAAGILALSPASNPVIVLPGSVVVDANSVAVLPFVEQPGDAAPHANVAAGLHRDLVAALRAVPGLYAIGEPSVSPYATSDLPASEIGAQLGARAVLSTDIAFARNGVLVTARLADAATDTLLWQARYDQPLEELPTIQVEILDGVAAALVDPELRARAVRGLTDPRAPNVIATTAAESAFE